MLFACNKSSVIINERVNKEEQAPPPPSGSNFEYAITYWGNISSNLPSNFDSIANSIIADGEVTNIEVDIYMSALGYADVDAFMADMETLQESYVSIIDDYGIDITTPEGKDRVVLLFENYFNFVDPGAPASCKSSYNGCIALAAAEAFAIHSGCLGGSFMPVIAVLCHASAVVWHKLQNDKCWNTYTSCLG